MKIKISGPKAALKSFLPRLGGLKGFGLKAMPTRLGKLKQHPRLSGLYPIF